MIHCYLSSGIIYITYISRVVSCIFRLYTVKKRKVIRLARCSLFFLRYFSRQCRREPPAVPSQRFTAALYTHLNIIHNVKNIFRIPDERNRLLTYIMRFLSARTIKFRSIEMRKRFDVRVLVKLRVDFCVKRIVQFVALN